MGEPRGFLKRHGFLVAGVALPLLVVAGFVLARTLPRLWVAEPRFEVLYAVRTGYDSQPRKLDRSIHVADGALRVRWTKSENPVYGQPMHVYRFHPATGAIEEIRVPEPENPDSVGSELVLPVGGLEGFRIDTSPRSPDGYEFENGSGGGSGLMNEMFLQRHRGPSSVISKGGRVVALPRASSEPYAYAPVEFLGWLVPAEAGR